jgi:hypothetical protein
MRQKIQLVVTTTFIGLAVIHSAFAQSGKPLLLGQFGDWGAYVGIENGQKVCFAISQPQRMESEPTQPRGQTYATFSMRPTQVGGELSIVMDYSFNSNLEATAQIGNEAFALYTKDNSAWIKNHSESARMIESLRRQPILLVKGASAGGVRTTDHYSLKGFEQAALRAAKACLEGATTPAVAPRPVQPAPQPRVPGAQPAPQPVYPAPQPRAPQPAPQPSSPACQRFPNLC